MIKIARFMLVHTAVRLDPNADEIVMYLRGRASRRDWFSYSPLDDEEYMLARPDSEPLSSPDTSCSSPLLPSSDSSRVHFSQPQRYGSGNTFAQWVTRQVNTFMVYRTQSPM